ncbi:hypothetical protein [Pseudonocardia acidicola]|uniref:MbtH protein n=1 Tax=Pseudonocardia acidicola TaxID=2724939 RepID=A0ABX1S5G4_9PSEU|nr:hypothetical protein [Pseudonocardia acidicola]NMH96022.1 hypothetical protein [Pseudonocardia acidicola]
MECPPEVEGAYVRRHDEAHARVIWAHPGMDNWSHDETGRVACTLRRRIVGYWSTTRTADLGDVRTGPAAG